MSLKLKQLWCVCSICFLFTGCWDSHEILSLGFVDGVAIEYREAKNIRLILQVAQPSSDKTSAKYLNVSQIGPTIVAALHRATYYSNKLLNFTHVHTILMNEELGKSKDFTKILDAFLKNNEFNRTAYMVFTQSSSEKILENRNSDISTPAVSLATLIQQAHDSLNTPAIITLGEFSKRMLNHSSFLIPRINVSNRKNTLIGSSVISGEKQQLIGWLTPTETQTVTLLTGAKYKSGLPLYINYHGSPIIYQVDNVNVNISSQLHHNQLSFYLDLKLRGKLVENWTTYQQFDLKFLKSLEKKINTHVKNKVQALIFKMQKELHTDIGDFSRVARTQQYPIWEKHKQNWDEYFTQVPIKVKVTSKVQKFSVQDKQ
ncbi:Ger(x)C family spore germination protein (plasmid) [Bacillus cereus]|uniref:Ger(x)C family spore germination protein n=1 Tax=Bacillus cereus TaxID=1396 RepID=UPI001F3F1D65|nr:Ger(x)C family spore germination protein [Bacillus cereus]UIJ69668.1 Ger(x)C family spore germination protein [Bacillus cereus]